MTWEVGIDENGLGPRLGPLVVTAVVAEVDDRARSRVRKPAQGLLATRLGDSKELVSFGSIELGEAWARVLAEPRDERIPHATHATHATPDDVARAILIDSPSELTSLCPPEHEAMCFGRRGESFGASDTLVRAVRSDLARLAGAGIRVHSAHSVIACTKRLNIARARGVSRFAVDLHAMERLALHVREQVGHSLEVTCGKVGGIDRYEPHFGPLAGSLRTTLVEGRAESRYAFPELGEIGFARDADANHLLVAMASLVGKYMRELLMHRIVRHFQAIDETLPDASGYHDPVTDRFVAASKLVRTKLKIESECFERTVAEKRSAKRSSTSLARQKMRA